MAKRRSPEQIESANKIDTFVRIIKSAEHRLPNYIESGDIEGATAGIVVRNWFAACAHVERGRATLTGLVPGTELDVLKDAGSAVVNVLLIPVEASVFAIRAAGHIIPKK
ncbi:MAG: hypothetical protein WAV41_00775 [Microgenomates group bacterium]